MASDIVLAIFLCAAGLVFAAHFPLCQRRAGLICAASIAADNICYLLAWSPIAPHMIMHCQATVIWSATALLAGGIIAEASAQYWWGRALIATYVMTILTYVLEQRGLAFRPVSMLTDYTHYLQIVIFAVVGGGGVRNKFADRYGHGCDHMDSHQTTL